MNKRIYLACTIAILMCVAATHLLFCIGNIPFKLQYYPLCVLYGLLVIGIGHIVLIIVEKKISKSTLEIHNNGIVIEFSEDKNKSVEIYVSSEGVAKISTKQRKELSNWLNN